MGNFPLTRIALNLSLIVALALQPMATYGTMAGCWAKCSASDALMCPGCGCCEVQDRNDRCCCCRDTDNAAEKEAAKPSCCSHDESSDSDVSDAPSADSQKHQHVCELSDSKASELGVRSVCACEQNPQPLSESSPTSPVKESRTSQGVGYVGMKGSENGGWLSLSTVRDRTDVSALAHFSQIVFCIWRL